MSVELKIMVNLKVPYRKPKFTLAERTAVVNGITMIRPLRNGQPGGTDAEVDALEADVLRLMMKKWAVDAGGTFTGHVIKQGEVGTGWERFKPHPSTATWIKSEP